MDKIILNCFISVVFFMFKKIKNKSLKISGVSALYGTDHNTFYKMLLYQRIQEHNRNGGHNNRGVFQKFGHTLQFRQVGGVSDLSHIDLVLDQDLFHDDGQRHQGIVS